MGITGGVLMKFLFISKKVLNHVKNPAYWINGAKHGNGSSGESPAT